MGSDLGYEYLIQLLKKCINSSPLAHKFKSYQISEFNDSINIWRDKLVNNNYDELTFIKLSNGVEFCWVNSRIHRADLYKLNSYRILICDPQIEDRIKNFFKMVEECIN
jgi:hypothetical protein